MAKRTTIEQIKEALESAGGFISHAAEMLGVSQSAVSQRIAKSTELQETLKQIEEANLDIAESELIKLMRRGNLGAICFYLKCKGKGRGYVEKQIISHDLDGQSIDGVNIEVVMKDGQSS